MEKVSVQPHRSRFCCRLGVGSVNERKGCFKVLLQRRRNQPEGSREAQGGSTCFTVPSLQLLKHYQEVEEQAVLMMTALKAFLFIYFWQLDIICTGGKPWFTISKTDEKSEEMLNVPKRSKRAHGTTWDNLQPSKVLVRTGVSDLVEGFNREFTSDFLGLTELGSDRTAQAVTDGLEKLFHDAGLDDWTTKLVAVCTDGAAVNVGTYNGVVPKLRQLVAVFMILFTSVPPQSQTGLKCHGLSTSKVESLTSSVDNLAAFSETKTFQMIELHSFLKDPLFLLPQSLCLAVDIFEPGLVLSLHELHILFMLLLYTFQQKLALVSLQLKVESLASSVDNLAGFFRDQDLPAQASYHYGCNSLTCERVTNREAEQQPVTETEHLQVQIGRLSFSARIHLISTKITPNHSPAEYCPQFEKLDCVKCLPLTLDLTHSPLSSKCRNSSQPPRIPASEGRLNKV
ncbi:hypothetical protein INR49_026211, partial [Caranx melampygus]